MYPEGTRNRNEGMLPFKRGAFHMAIQAHIPIVPVVMHNYDHIYSSVTYAFRPGCVRHWQRRAFMLRAALLLTVAAASQFEVTVLPPVSTAELTREGAGGCETVRDSE